MAHEEIFFYGEDKWNDNHFVYQLEPHQSILKALISKLKSGIGGDNKHELWVEERKREDAPEDSRAPGSAPSSAGAEKFDSVEARIHHGPEQKRRVTSGIPDEGSWTPTSQVSQQPEDEA